MLMRLRLIVFVIAVTIGLLFYGIDNISNSDGDSARAGRSKKCVTLTYEQFVKRHPTEGWFHITGGVLDLPSARAHLTTYGHGKSAENNGTVTSLDIPLRSASDYDSDSPPASPVLVATNNADLVEKWKALNEMGSDGSSDEDDNTDKPDAKPSKSTDAAQKARLDKYVTENWDKIFVRQDVEGIVKTDSLSEKSDDESQPDAAPDHMTADYVVLDEGKIGTDYKTRSTQNGVIALTILAACWGLGIFVWRANRQRPGGGGYRGGGGTPIVSTDRNGQPVIIHSDAGHRFGGGSGGRQNPWSNGPG